MDNIFLESTVHWLSENIVKFKADVGVCKKYAKVISGYKSSQVATQAARFYAWSVHGDNSNVARCTLILSGLGYFG